jgi:hypothetical protein
MGDLPREGIAGRSESLYASQTSGWFGQVIQRSSDGGRTWEPVGNKFVYDGVAGTHTWYDGTPHPWEFKRVWHLEPSLDDPDKVYAGVEDAAMFLTADGGKTWDELPGLRRHESGQRWQPGAGGLCLHTILLDPVHPGRMFIAISAAGAFRSDDVGVTWRPINRGASVAASRTRTPKSATACTGWLCTARVLMCYSCRSTGTSCAPTMAETSARSERRSADDSASIDVHAHEPRPSTPCRSRATEHYVPDGKLRVYRSRTGGNEWEALTNASAARLLRQRPARRDGRRRADSCGSTSAPQAAGVCVGRRRELGADRSRGPARRCRWKCDTDVLRLQRAVSD